MQKLIETKNLFTDFNTFEGVVKALNGVALVVNEGETYGLVGESGCGKSVAVRSLMRIVQAPGLPYERTRHGCSPLQHFSRCLCLEHFQQRFVAGDLPDCFLYTWFQVSHG